MTSLIFLIALVPLVASSDDIDDEKIEELMKMFKEKGMGASITMPKKENEKFLRGQAASFCMKFKKQLPRKECKQEIIEALNENSKGLVYMSEAGKNVKTCVKTTKKIKKYGEAKKELEKCVANFKTEL